MYDSENKIDCPCPGTIYTYMTIIVVYWYRIYSRSQVSVYETIGLLVSFSLLCLCGLSRVRFSFSIIFNNLIFCFNFAFVFIYFCTDIYFICLLISYMKKIKYQK